MIFPIDELLDEQRSYDWLLEKLHPNGLHCPAGHPLPAGQQPHNRDRAPLLDYRCHRCGSVFNIFTSTPLCGIRYPISKVVLMLRGFFEGKSTRSLARELGVDRGNLLEWRHRVQALIEERFPPRQSLGQGY